LGEGPCNDAYTTGTMLTVLTAFAAHKNEVTDGFTAAKVGASTDRNTVSA